jgi:hypothetical protein
MTYAPPESGVSIEEPEGLPSMLNVIVTVKGLSEDQSKYITSGVLKVLQEAAGGKPVVMRGN